EGHLTSPLVRQLCRVTLHNAAHGEHRPRYGACQARSCVTLAVCSYPSLDKSESLRVNRPRCQGPFHQRWEWACTYYSGAVSDSPSSWAVLTTRCSTCLGTHTPACSHH